MNKDFIKAIFAKLDINEKVLSSMSEGKETIMYRDMLSGTAGYEDHFSDMARKTYLKVSCKPAGQTVVLIIYEETVFNMWKEERVERYNEEIQRFNVDRDNFDETVGKVRDIILRS